jgi:hypothetical protein
MNMLISKLDIFSTTPDSDSKLLSERSGNEAYLTYVKGKQYAVYFPRGGSVALDLTKEQGTFTVEWLSIAESKWQKAADVSAGVVKLTAPDEGHWVALLTKLKR